MRTFFAILFAVIYHKFGNLQAIWNFSSFAYIFFHLRKFSQQFAFIFHEIYYLLRSLGVIRGHYKVISFILRTFLVNLLPFTLTRVQLTLIWNHLHIFTLIFQTFDVNSRSFAINSQSFPVFSFHCLHLDANTQRNWIQSVRSRPGCLDKIKLFNEKLSSARDEFDLIYIFSNLINYSCGFHGKGCELNGWGREGKFFFALKPDEVITSGFFTTISNLSWNKVVFQNKLIRR